MPNVDQLHYVGTDKGMRIDKLQDKIHERLFSECTINDIGHAITKSDNIRAIEIERCFHAGRSSEFYQLIVNLMYERYLQQATDRAMEIGEYEY